MISTVMTEREDGISSTTNATTKASEPNVKIITMPWWQMVGIRVLRVYLQTLSGFIVSQGLGISDALGLTLSTGDSLHKLWILMGMSLIPAIVSLIQNTVEILTKLDISNPQMRA